MLRRNSDFPPLTMTQWNKIKIKVVFICLKLEEGEQSNENEELYL